MGAGHSVMWINPGKGECMPRIELVLGDITRQQVDVVVNAANSSLLGGGGVDAAIHEAAGPALHAACRALRSGEYPHGLPAGQAVATTAGDLSATWVVHTVGPLFEPGEDRSDVLASCYRESLRLADQLGATSVAFPAVSAGVYRWPIEDAAAVAVGTVLSTPTEVALVRFVLFTEPVYEAFEAALDGAAIDLTVGTDLTAAARGAGAPPHSA
jgi:O-acetyl-ADP-ribose deacetylase (regulator of RNase III)